MKTKKIISSFIIAITLAGCATHDKHARQAKLEAQAKVSRAEAESAALARVPGGNVKEGELEKEHGKLIWSFDIATAGSTDISEVAVDALTGQVISVEKETAEDEAKEKHHDKKEKKAQDDKM